MGPVSSTVSPPRYQPAPLRALRHASPVFSFRGAPIVFAAVAFCLGICFAGVAWRPPLFLLSATLAAGCSTWIARRWALRVALLPLCVTWLLLGIFAAQMAPVPDRQTALLANADMLQRRVAGHVTRVMQQRDADTREVRTQF